MRLFVGMNWDIELLEMFNELNQKHFPDIIGEIYGSIKGDPLGQVREETRLSDISFEDASKFIKKAHSYGIDVCYAMNSPIITPRQISATSSEIDNFIKWMVDVEMDSAIIASPALAKFLKQEYADVPFKIIGSTVLDLRTIEQIEMLQDNFDRLCPATDTNRNIHFLHDANELMKLEILVNEMCIFQCPWRNYHYCQEASSQMFESSKILKGFESYPIDECWKCFVDRPSNILKSRWVRPEDIHLYESVGIEWFKLSGRTMPTEWIIRVAKAYVERTYDGNLLDLFPIVTGSLSKEKEGNKIFYIDNNAIDGLGAELLRRDNGNCSLGCKIISCDICDREWESYKESGIVREMKI